MRREVWKALRPPQHRRHAARGVEGAARPTRDPILCHDQSPCLSRNGHIARISTCETIGLSSATEVVNMNGNRYYGVRVEGAKYGVGFGSALAIAISYTANNSILWAIIHGILGWLYVIYFALFRS
jgi:hypothetical protein